MGQNVRISKTHRLILQHFAPDLLEQLAELEWLREQVRRAEARDPKKLLAAFKAHREQKANKAHRERKAKLRRVAR
jgi:hypothetical protein